MTIYFLMIVLRRLPALLVCLSACAHPPPFDERAVVARHPALRGIVVTAAEYVGEYNRHGSPVGHERAPARALMPGDQIMIEVEDEPSLSRVVTIPDDPVLIVPDLGRLHVAGLTDEDLEKDLVRRLARLIKRPIVHVTLGEPTVPPVDVVGAVPRPGRVDRRRSVTMGSALEASGGTSVREILVVSPHRKRVIVCDNHARIAGKDVRQDVPLICCDVVVVPRDGSPDWGSVERFMAGELDRAAFIAAH